MRYGKNRYGKNSPSAPSKAAIRTALRDARDKLLLGLIAPEQVADRLAEAGCRGAIGDCRTCPLAVWFVRELAISCPLPEGWWIAVSDNLVEVRCSTRPDDVVDEDYYQSCGYILQEPMLRYFLGFFDGGSYPELITKEA